MGKPVLADKRGKVPMSMLPAMSSGPQGPVGPQGPPGADSTVPGPQGIPGPQGLTGSDGAQGLQGNAGPQGIPGNDGAQGIQGIPGLQGNTGPPGNDGAPGLQGNQGPQGIQGIPGDTGPSGADGQGVPVGGTTGQVLKKASAANFDTAWSNESGGGGGPSTVKITADQTKNNTTLADITGLSFSLTSGIYYRFVFEIIMRTATNTTGPRLSVSVPAFTVFAAKVTGPITSDGAANEFRGEVTASNDPVILTALPVANTDYMCKIEGIIKPSANGTLQARFANETGAVVVTVRNGSMGFLWDLGA